MSTRKAQRCVLWKRAFNVFRACSAHKSWAVLKLSRTLVVPDKSRTLIIKPLPRGHCLSSQPLLCGSSPRVGSLEWEIPNILRCPGCSSIAKTPEILQCLKLWCHKAGKPSAAYARCKGLSPPTPLLSIPPPWTPCILFSPSRCFSFPLTDHYPALVISLLWVTLCQECFFTLAGRYGVRARLPPSQPTRKWHLPSHQHRVNEKDDKWHANAFPGGYRKVTSLHLSEEWCLHTIRHWHPVELS